MNLEKFFDAIRNDVNLTTQNVQGMTKVLEYLEAVEDNLQQAAYILATAWWETAQTMMPVREAYWIKNAEAWRKKNLKYYPYYGRGYVQLTWDYNYKKASDYFKVDFVKNPDLVMEIEYALPILVVGMNEGWFTGKDLEDYIDDIDESDDEDLKEYKLARKIVNGTDKAETIGRLSLSFEKGLKAGGYEFKMPLVDVPKPVDEPEDTPGISQPETAETSESASVSLLRAIVEMILIFLKGRK